MVLCLKKSNNGSKDVSLIVAAKRQLEDWLGHEVKTFAWVVSFMTNSAVIRPDADLLQLQRTHTEAFFPLDTVRLGLAGVSDLVYAPKRRRVNRLTGTC